MKKISYYAVLIIVFFVFLSCKTGDINMPKPSKNASSSAKLEQIEDIFNVQVSSNGILTIRGTLTSGCGFNGY